MACSCLEGGCGWGGARPWGRHRGETRRRGGGDMLLDSMTGRNQGRVVLLSQEPGWPLNVCPCVHSLEEI
jgi:hypothetical protein